MAVPPRSRGILEARARTSWLLRQAYIPAQSVVHSPVVGGLVLFAATLVAIAWANSPWADSYFHLLHHRMVVDLGFINEQANVLDWIDEGAMALFFVLVGVEIRQAMTVGELATPRQAILPVLAAFAGVVLPAAVYLAFTWGTPFTRGWAIPISTDIAFALGVLSGIRGVPSAMRTFTLGYATADDIIGVAVIAAFYTGDLHGPMLVTSALALVAFWGFRMLHPRTSGFTVAIGFGVWVAMLESGIHAAVIGVPLGLLLGARVPRSRSDTARELGTLADRYARAAEHDDQLAEELEGRIEEVARSTEPPAVRVDRRLRPWVTLLVLPVFALANAGVVIDFDSLRGALSSRAALGTFFGLAIGAPVGVLLALWLGERRGLGFGLLAFGRSAVLGFASLSGIGFTIALFIAELAFKSQPAELNSIKCAILAASALDALIGAILLHWGISPRRAESPEVSSEERSCGEER